MNQRLLVQTQLSNYDTKGRFILECDSSWQMCMGRARVMLELNPELQIDVMCPQPHQVVTTPEQLNSDLLRESGNRLRFITHKVISNAPLTRYDFDMDGESRSLDIAWHKNDASRRYTHVYINDPMLLRHFRAMFFLNGGYLPKFFVHSHFIDNPEDPKFPTEISLWFGQCEAAIKADYNFWQCKSAMQIFLDSMSKNFNEKLTLDVYKKSMPWDDGYSVEEIKSEVARGNIRYRNVDLLMSLRNKVVIFVPNRVGGRGRSSDYTNCGKFLFEIVPELWKKRQDFVVIAGNPSQKFSNVELKELCPALLNLVPDALHRDEYKNVAANSDIAVGLYTHDAYGGTAARECVELGCLPLWVNMHEYKRIANAAGRYPWMVQPDLTDSVLMLDALIENCKEAKINQERQQLMNDHHKRLLQVIRDTCSYEKTTEQAMRVVNLLET